jgi:serine phosphatase RsbU (regulator of sigma subunit)
MEVQIAAAKVNRYATSESGDTLEVVERPNGGVSVVLADGQSSGRGAKAISLRVVRTVVKLLAEGVRDGAAARAASDALYTEKQGRVVSTLNIASIDLHSSTIVLTRNNPAPTYVLRSGQLLLLAEESTALGSSRSVRPSVSELVLEAGLWIVLHTDGLTQAGERRGKPMDVPGAIARSLEGLDPQPQQVADGLLEEAVRLDEDRPADDISVVVMTVAGNAGDGVRRMTVRLPIGLPSR